MAETLPHTQNGFAQTAAEQHFRGQHDDAASTSASSGATPIDDPTTLKFDGNVAIADDDAGSDPYNRTGRFRRLVR